MNENHPRPLAEIASPRWASIGGVLTDIDDTLTADGAIQPIALGALERLAAAGVPVIAITGRPAGWSEPFVLAWPLAAIVAENGAVMLRREGSGLRRDFAQDEATRAANRLRLEACAAAVLAAVPGSHLAADSGGRLTDIAIDHGEFSHLGKAEIAAVVATMRAHGLTATVSSIHINGWIGTHSKWSGARWAVSATLGVELDPARWVFVGDSTNDQAMFECIPLSVGVANVARFLAQMTAPPAYIAAGERGRGFAEVADALLAARGTA